MTDYPSGTSCQLPWQGEPCVGGIGPYVILPPPFVGAGFYPARRVQRRCFYR